MRLVDECPRLNYADVNHDQFYTRLDRVHCRHGVDDVAYRAGPLYEQVLPLRTVEALACRPASRVCVSAVGPALCC